MFVWVSTAPVSILSTLGLAWVATRKRRILNSNKYLNRKEIIERIHKGELDKIKGFAPRDNTKDVLETDAEFWECIGGLAGLRRQRENAVCCVQLCQVYVRDSNMDKQDVEPIARKAFHIGWLLHVSILEESFRRLGRLLRWEMPHFCARWIVPLYFEVASQTRMLNLEYGTGHLAL